MENIIDIIGKEEFDKINYEKTFGANSIVITAIDSIFSIQAKYYATVKPLVIRFANYVGLKDIDNDDYTPKEFVETFKNKQRTSSTNGILKAEALYNVLDMLNNNNIQTRDDILNCSDIEKIENQWKRIKGQKSGITWRYFLMGCGNNTYFKDDTWIYRFFIEKLGYNDIRKGNDYQKLKDYFHNEYIKVKQIYPQITITKLDNVIWEYMAAK